MNRILASLCLSFCIALMPQNAWAILDSCTVSATGVGFGDYDSASFKDSTGTVTVTCFGLLGGTFHVQLSTGQSGSYTPRKLYKVSDTLEYNLYTDIARSSIWGNGAGGTVDQSVNCILLCLGAPNVFTVYGRIPSGQSSAAAGNYSDTITVTVSF